MKHGRSGNPFNEPYSVYESTIDGCGGRGRIALAAFLLLGGMNVLAQRQYADSAYMPPPLSPLYSVGEGPGVWIDEGHYNFHTREGRYLPFSRVIGLDGYRVGSHPGMFTSKNLAGRDILVIANALPESSVEKWEAPAAFGFAFYDSFAGNKETSSSIVLIRTGGLQSKTA